MAMWNIVKQEEMDLILSGKYTSKELSKKLNRHCGTINKIARENNVKLPRKYTRLYKIKEDFFDTPTEESSYILGFIAADGCILEGKNKKPSIVEISLAEKDRNHLLKMKNMISVDVPLKEIKKTNAVRCSLCSIKLAESLVKKGIMPRKSLTLKFPDIPKEYIRHFIRGYFDGDGYIRERGNRRFKYIYSVLEVSMLGTKWFLEDIKEEFYLIYGNKVGSLKSCEKWYNAHRLTFSTKSAIEFCKWIYSDCSIKLDRKFEVYNNFIKKKEE